jgi:hypothetical protein
MLEVISVCPLTIAKNQVKGRTILEQKDLCSLCSREMTEENPANKNLRLNREPAREFPNWYYYHVFEYWALMEVFDD